MLTISMGHSDKNWISYTGLSHTSRAIRQSDGEIKTETVSKKAPPSNWSTLQFNPVTSFLFGIFSTFVIYILPIIKGFWLNPMIKRHEVSSYYYLISVPLIILLIIFGVISIINTDPKHEIRKNHGAEHKVIRAYEELEYIPTINKAQNFSRISSGCGATIYSALITGQLIGYFVYIYYGFMIPELLLYIVPLFFHSVFPFNLFGKIVQFFTTDKPDDDNIELAIAALTELMHTENSIYFAEQKALENFKKEFREKIRKYNEKHRDDPF